MYVRVQKWDYILLVCKCIHICCSYKISYWYVTKRVHFSSLNNATIYIASTYRRTTCQGKLTIFILWNANRRGLKLKTYTCTFLYKKWKRKYFQIIYIKKYSKEYVKIYKTRIIHYINSTHLCVSESRNWHLCLFI